MKKSRDIEVVRLSSELASTQSRVAFLEELQAGCVSRELYEAAIAERDAAKAETEARDRLHAEEIASIEDRHAAELAAAEQRHKAELDAKDLQLKEYQEMQALLQTENTDFKTLWRFWQGHHFGASSETMTDLMDRIVGKLPTSAAGMTADVLTETRRLRERDRMCRPLVDAMFAFMQKVKDAGNEYGVLARRAADYLLNDREGFRAFLDCALLEIGNNAVERCFRAIAKGRENWLQCGSHEAAKHTAFMYSLVESCRMNGLDFGLYIETVLRRILDGDTDIHGMLPNVITLPKEGQNSSAA